MDEGNWIEERRESTANMIEVSSDRMFGLAGAVVFALAAAGCAGPQFPEKHGAVFQQAVEASEGNDPAEAAASAYHYIQGATVDDPRYDRALRVLARNTERLGLSYAASMWYLDIARSRRNVALIDDAIAGLERIIREYPYDRETILRGFLASAEITGLAVDQRAFVSYHKGLDSLRRGHEKWAAESFQKIPDGNPYRLRARYALAVREVATYDLETAKEELEKLLEEPLPEDLRVKVRRTLGRTEFEERDYEAALEHYRAIQSRAPDHPRLLLEMAWNHYYLGDYRRALGLLLALDAPAYRELIAPKRYLLEAMSLRKLCQYGPARKAAVRLEQAHGDALDDLYEGVQLERSEPLREAAGVRAGGRRVAEFRDRVAAERDRLEELDRKLGPELIERLEAIYEQGMEEAERREREELTDKARELAGELIEAENGVQLILHELGVSLLRGERESTQSGGGELLEQTDVAEQVVYRFRGEFWTDELDDLVVQLEDRCIEE